MSTRNDFSLSPEIEPAFSILKERQEFYEQHAFHPRHDNLLKAFCDVIYLDYDIQAFFRACVAVAEVLGEFQAVFYLHAKKSGQLRCVCDSRQGIIEPPGPAEKSLHPSAYPYEMGNSLVIPLFARSRRHGEIDEDPERTGQDSQQMSREDLYDPDPYFSSHSLLGLYVVSPLDQLSREDRLFFEVLCPWIGYKLNNRLLSCRHIEHLAFFNALGRDIGHDIIIPNMYLKYLLRQLEKNILSLGDIEESINIRVELKAIPEVCSSVLAEYGEVRKELSEWHQQLFKYHNQISLFLESLFRQEHFSRGHFVLQAKKCFVERDIIIPQLDIYASRLKTRGITIDQPKDMYEQEFPLMVDVGLLSQVYANLFSNAVKYTEEIVDHKGISRKAIAYGAEKVENFPQPGLTGIKFNVFSTGRPLTAEERVTIFQEGARGEHAQGIPGSGHGLDFINRVIKLHGGKTGCEANDEGNNFYFILPLSSTKKSVFNE